MTNAELAEAGDARFAGRPTSHVARRSGNRNADTPEALKTFLVPYDAHAMNAEPVSTEVNSARL